MKRIAMTVLCLGAVACNGTESKIQEAVRSSLRDPASAIFGETRLAPSGTAACVVVNARNSFGGYTGNQVATVYLDQASGTWEAADVSELSMDTCMQIISSTSEQSVTNAILVNTSN